jgi:hypothetical protein
MPTPPPRARRDSLAGLPQFDEASYGRGKRRSTKDAALVESAMAVDDEDFLASGGVVVEPLESSDWFREAVHDAMSAITEDQPHIDEAIKGPESDQWKEAIEAELTQIEKLGTWDIVEAPLGANIIDSRFVLRRKRDAQGNISRYKARLVAKGFKQRFGVDYTDTFAPTVRASTLRTLLSIAGTLGDKVVVEQADAKNAYLNSWLHKDEVIYMSRPQHFDTFRSLPAEFVNKPKKSIVLRLRRPLYGTKQGAHHWYEELKRILLLLRFQVLLADEAVFYKIEGAKFVIIAAATDDFTFIADSTETTTLVKSQMNEHFELVDLGPINWLLGVSVVRDVKNRTISLGQEAYIEQILARFQLDGSRPAVTPMEPGADFTPDSPSVSPTLLTAAEKTTYREMIGSLMYLAVMTRPDISFAVSTLSQYLDTPRTTHLNAVRRIFRYLSGTKRLKLILGGKVSNVVGFSDADWASHMHRHSISGFAFFVGQGAVSWSAKKQPIITLSSTESEYVALTHSSKEIIWLHKLLKELSFIYSLSLPTTLHCDNQGAIELSKDSKFHARTKHIDVHFHFVRQTVAQGHISIKYCPTDDMIADIFTKSLARVKFQKFRALLNVL